MVIFFEWTAMEPKSSCGLPVTEDTGLEASASSLAGYLGKVQERASSLDYCPWCTSKGLTSALRSYRINLQESITLCTNPLCLFPLVSRSLDDVLASLVPVEPSVGSKRKNVLALEGEELIKPLHKRLRYSQHDTHHQQSSADTLDSQAEHADVNILSNGQHAAVKTDTAQSNGHHRDCLDAERGQRSQQEDRLESLDKEPENVSALNGSVSTCSSSAGYLQSSPDTLLITEENEHESEKKVEKSPEIQNKCCSDESLFVDGDMRSVKFNTLPLRHDEQTAKVGMKSSLDADSGTECVQSEAETRIMESSELVAVPSQHFWRNSNKLCWLDSLLVALVNCKSLKKLKPEVEPQQSTVWRLLQRYEEICAAVQVHHQTGKDGVVRVPNNVLCKTTEDLHSLRMSIFELLQPKLHCKLGQRETPVFAMPLLLTMDSWAEPLFQSTFHWEFKCSKCKVATTEGVMKTLPTFTSILPDWHPLHAVHSAPCNMCCQKKQRREMMLQSVSPVFALHFVDGLPDNDVRLYTFTFKGKRYSVTTIIQYKQHLKHFVTWVRNPDGSWVEYDDLKHPDSKTHRKLSVRGPEMHIVFWEAEDDKESRACSPSSTIAGSPSENETCNKDLRTDQPQTHCPEQSIVTSHNDTDIMCALTATEDTATDLDASIGSTTLLDTFKGLCHNDIVTLTLVELMPDSETQPLNDIQQKQELDVSHRNEILDSTPDSSSTVRCNEMSHTPDAVSPTTTNSSESEDNLSSDPTFVPGTREERKRTRGAGRGKPVSKQNAKKGASGRVASHASVSSQPLKVVSKDPEIAPAQANPQVEATPQVSPISSTGSTPLCRSKVDPTIPTMPDHSARLSFLLSHHPQHQVQKSVPKHPPTSLTQVKKPTPPAHSTPNIARKRTVSPRPQLMTEKSDGLPIKAAEMYGAFGAKTANTQTLPLPCDNSSPFQPPNLLTNTTAMSRTPLPALGQKALPEICSKKHSSQSLKVPPGLSTTETLRFKLIKKLKAKKKKLAKLNEMLGHQDGTSFRPDSTDLSSPNTVTSSTYDSSICDDFLSDLLSPATTASNLSPDSTDFLEMLTNRQDGATQLDCGVSNDTAASQISTYVKEPYGGDFLEDFLSQAVAQRPTVEETEALSGLDLFV
ncbi:SUMO-specific isopeptidase USPL1 isoform X1 [Xyrichtys novacula]|nr:SUMO-specific isopeptidase USPL1 isoform X1 [Xyrichtys novacula]